MQGTHELLTDWRDAITILAESIGQIQTCDPDRFEERYMVITGALEVAENAHALLTLDREKHRC
jgi:hypothetical protein